MRTPSLFAVLLLAGCGTIERPARLPDGPPLIPQLKAEPRQRVVVLPELVPIVFAWDSDATGWVDFHAYYGWTQDSITNLFGVTRGVAITNHILWPIGAENIYGAVYAQNAFGRSDPSYIARLPDWPVDAVKVDCTPPVDGQVLLWESPNQTHWFGSWVRLPHTNAIQPAAFYRISPEYGVTGSGQVPVTLTIEPLRLKNHFGG